MSRLRTQSIFAFLISLTLVLPAHATVKNWIAGDGNWSVDTNWSPTGRPTTGDDASIVFTDGVARTVTYDVHSSDGPNLFSLDLVGSSSNSSTLVLPANQFSAVEERIGIDGNGTFTQSGGTNLVVGGKMTLGFNNAGVGKYNLNAGSVFVLGDEIIGLDGQGVFTQTSGDNFAGNNFIVGANQTSLGTYTLNGGTLSSGFETIGSLATGNASQAGGTFIQNGGSNAPTALVIGINPGATGSYTLNAGSLQINSGYTLVVGSQGGSGNLMQTGGSLTTSSFSIGSGGGSTGTYVLSGGIANVYTLSVGDGSPGAYGTGTTTVTGSNSVLNATNAIIVQGAGSKFNFQGGTITTPQINVSGDPSRFSWTGGTLDITVDTTWDSGANPNSTSVIFGNSLSLSSGRTLKVEGNETIGVSGAFTLSVNTNAIHTVLGDITVKAGGTFSESSGALVELFHRQ